MKIEEMWHNLKLRTSLTLADISKDISNLCPQENNTSSFNYFQLEHLLDSDSEFVALLRLEVRSHCPNWPIWITWVAQPNIKQHQEVTIVVFLLEVFDVDTSQLWLSGATVRPRQRGRRGIDASGGPLGDTIYSKCFPPVYCFFVFSMVFSGFSQNHSNCIIDCSNPDQDQNVWYEKGLHIRKSQRAQKKAHSLSIPTKCLLCSCSFLVI